MVTAASFLSVNGSPVSAEDALRMIRRHLGRATYSDWAAPVINEILVRDIAQRENLGAVSDTELQDAVDQYRREMGLYTKTDTERWLAENHRTVEDLEQGVETRVLHARWCDRTVGSQVDPYFDEHRSDFDGVTMSQIVVADENIARELKEQLDQGEADFATLARAYSVDDSAQAGGFLGTVTRGMLSPEVESAVFGAKEGDTVGPVKSDQGYHILKVDAFTPAELNETTRIVVRDILMQPYIDAERAKIRVEVNS